MNCCSHGYTINRQDPTTGDTITSDDWNFEIQSVLYNLAIIYSQMQGDLKELAIYYQSSAGVFDYIKDKVPFGTSSMQCFVDLMLGQAQESFSKKAQESNLKAMNLSKLLMQTSVFYTNALIDCEYEDKFKKLVELKSLHFKRLALYQRSIQAEQEAKYGEQVSYLEEAVLIAKQIDKLSYIVENHLFKSELKEIDQLINLNKLQAVKDNDRIYMQSSPKFKDLDPVVGVVMVKPRPLDKVEFEPLFKAVVPIKVVEMTSEYDYKKDMFVKNVGQRVKDGIQLSKTSLQSMALPNSIEALEQPVGLPASVLEASKMVREKGGYKFIAGAFGGVLDKHEKMVKRISELKIALENERMMDDKYRQQVINWTRMDSLALTKQLRKDLDQFGENLSKAGGSNEQVRRNLEECKMPVEHLSLSKQELLAMVPNVANTSLINDDSFKKLKQQLSMLGGNMKNSEIVLKEMEQLAKMDDISQVLVQNLASACPLTKQELFDQQLQRYDNLDQKLKKFEIEQQEILSEIRRLNTEFQNSRANNRQLKDRQQALQNLEKAKDYFQAIIKNIENAGDFYDGLERGVEMLGERIGVFCRSRMAEGQRLLQQHQNGI